MQKLSVFLKKSLLFCGKMPQNKKKSPKNRGQNYDNGAAVSTRLGALGSILLIKIIMFQERKLNVILPISPTTQIVN